MFRDYSDCSEELKEEIRRIKFKPYYKIAMELIESIYEVSSTNNAKIIRFAYVKHLKLLLTALLYDKRLDEFTKIYKDTTATTKVNVGYDQQAVTTFAKTMNDIFVIDVVYHVDLQESNTARLIKELQQIQHYTFKNNNRYSDTYSLAYKYLQNDVLLYNEMLAEMVKLINKRISEPSDNYDDLYTVLDVLNHPHKFTKYVNVKD